MKIDTWKVIYRLLQINTLIDKYEYLNKSMNKYVAYVQSVNKNCSGTRIDFEPRWGYTTCCLFFFYDFEGWIRRALDLKETVSTKT